MHVLACGGVGSRSWRERTGVRLLVMSAAHMTVDAFATMPFPLVALYFQAKHEISKPAALVILSVMAATTSLLQPVWGYMSDRLGTRAILPWMPAGAGVMMIAAILAPTWWATLTLAGICGCFVAAFHPEGASAAGQSWPARRSLAMAVFLVGGTAGLSSGPVVISYLIEHYSAWTSIWLVVLPLAVSGFLVVLHSGDGQRRGPVAGGFKLAEAFRGRKGVVALLVAISTLRTLALMGVISALPYLLAQRSAGLSATGRWVGLFVIGGGAGMLVCNLLIRPRAERKVLSLTLLAAVPVLGVFPQLQGWAALAALACAGALIYCTVPVVVAMGQRIVPAGMSTASSLMMGLSWGIGGTIAPMITAVFPDPRTAICLFAGVLVIPGMASLLLPAFVTDEPEIGKV